MSLSPCLSPAFLTAARTATTLNFGRIITTSSSIRRNLHVSSGTRIHHPRSFPKFTSPYSTQPPPPTSPHVGRLANKVAIVTGSSGGIGRAIALRFAREGAKVLCADLQALAGVSVGGDETHIATHDLIMREGGVGAFLKCDVGEAEEVEELVHQAAEIWGRVDVMVNNAGIAIEGDATTGHSTGLPIHLTPLSMYDKTMRINARGTFLGTKYAVQQMMKQDVGPTGDRGWIINMGSIAGLIAFAGNPAYCSSKGATLQLTKQVAVDYGPHKIHCNAICPGGIATAMINAFRENEALSAYLVSKHPWGHLGAPEDIAGAAVFLASADAAFVTGACLPVDGGFVAQ